MNRANVYSGRLLGSKPFVPVPMCNLCHTGASVPYVSALHMLAAHLRHLIYSNPYDGRLLGSKQFVPVPMYNACHTVNGRLTRSMYIKSILVVNKLHSGLGHTTAAGCCNL
jgi:hypothetical protein